MDTLDYPRVSIVVPCYNHEKFVAECLASIANQTYRNIETIIIDDGSTDGSVGIIRKLIEGYRGAKSDIIIQPNQGAHAAINTGVRRAQGKYITILNSDDVYAANRIALLVEQCESHNKEIAFTKVNYIDDKGKQVSSTHPLVSSLELKQSQIPAFVSVGFAILNSNVAVTSGNLFFSKTLYERLGEFRGYKYCHDWDFLLRAVCLTEPLYIDEASYFYRIHQGNTYSTLQGLAMEETLDTLWGYLLTVERTDTVNLFAPSERNWPYYFEYFIGERKRFVSDRRKKTNKISHR